MAQLSAERRAFVWAEFMADVSASREQLGRLTKQEVHGAIASIDDWMDFNMASLDAAIPADACTALSAKQRLKMMLLIVGERLEVS